MKYILMTFFTMIAALAPLSRVHAAPTGITYQGRILNPSGTPLESNNVQFFIKIVSSNVDECTLFEETHTLNMTNSDGLFSINVGSGVRSGDDVGLTMTQVMTNTGSRTGLSCVSGATSYTPADSHTRLMQVSFNDGGGLVTFPSAYTIRSVPYAMEANSVAGFHADNLCRVANAGVPQTVAALTSANFTELLALINGTSLQYTKVSSAAGTGVSVVNGNPSTPVDGSLWLDSATGQLKYRTGSTTKVVGTADGSVTSVAAGTGLTGGTITMTGTLAVDVGTVAGKIVQLNSSAELPAVSGANLTSLNADNLASGTLSSSRLPTGVVTPNTYRSVTVDTTGRVTAGTNPTTLTGYGITDAVIKGGQTGALSLGTSDSNAVNINTNGSPRVTVLPSGFFGVGTTNPLTTFHVASTAGDAEVTIHGAKATGANASMTFMTTLANGTTNYSWLLADWSGNMVYHPATGQHAFQNSTSGTSMLINNAGYVGIGTGSPQTALHVYRPSGGNAAIFQGAGSTGVRIDSAAGAQSSTMTFSKANSARWMIRNDGIVEAAGNVGSDFNLDRFDNSGTLIDTVMFIKRSSGNVGIGTTSPSSKLQVAGEITPATDNTYTLGDSSHRFMTVHAVNGTIQTSDYRQKKNITDSDLGLDFINKLRPVSYHWISGADKDLHYGLIAQETEAAIKQSKAERGIASEDSTIVTRDKVTDRYGLNYSELISPIIKAIHELYSQAVGTDERLATVEAESALLKQENADLKQENAQIKMRLQKIESALSQAK